MSYYTNLQKALDYIEEHAAEKLGIDRVARGLYEDVQIGLWRAAERFSQRRDRAGSYREAQPACNRKRK